MDRRLFLRGGAAAAAVALANPVKALAAHAGEAGDEAALPLSVPMRPFAVDLKPYATPERMADKIRMIEDLPKLTRHWRAVVRQFQAYGRLGQMAAVNRFVNQVPYVTDSQLYGKVDAWEDPIHFFGHGGDCEEYALAKYAMLYHLGFHKDRLMVVALVRLDDLQGHAVLAVSLGGEVYVLDQLRKEMLPDQDFTGYRVRYTICSRGVHVPIES